MIEPVGSAVRDGEDPLVLESGLMRTMACWTAELELLIRPTDAYYC